MSNKDLQLLETICSDQTKTLIQNTKQALNIQDVDIEHPLDETTLKKLAELKSNIRPDDDDFILFNSIDEIKKIWKLIIQKSLKCLRYFDSREPFKDIPSKKPIAYGIQDLSDYFDKYSDFESMLYGGVKYYRDHVIHVFRTWLLGMDCLLKNNGTYLNRVTIGEGVQINSLEKISIWSMIALTHDLGYPLEKAQEIIGKTKDMMKSFVVNPNISMDLSFSGVQNNMNDYVLRFLSSKMIDKLDETTKPYVARLQPKYYFKYQKSLEQSMHGIISAIIIYKLLIYFLESDYSINEDYRFDAEEVRQFYIRREILRSIASHTCEDIYHLDMLSFAYLLIIVDDAQEWGRKRISELYVKSETKYELENINLAFNSEDAGVRHSCTITEKFSLPKDKEVLNYILGSLQRQSLRYKEIFRDGQDTTHRNFTFIKKCYIEYNENSKVKINVEFSIFHDKNSAFRVTVDKTGTNDIDEQFNANWISKVYGLTDSELAHSVITNEKITYEIPDKNE